MSKISFFHSELLNHLDYSAVVKISHLETGQTFQEIEIPNAGAVTAGIWIKLLEDGNEVEGFAIGTVHGVVEIYKRVQNVLSLSPEGLECLFFAGKI